jgi:ubiquinone/menaquinone biosynthesis C-methylase UbiE
MHISAQINAQKFYTKYCTNLSKNAVVVDFGSYDINGTLKPIFEKHTYIGIDMCPGPNVDIVCKNESTPFKDESADIITSSSCFEHDEFYWITFLEMCRLIKTGGYIYIQAPSNGRYHACPQDCWRFYADSWKSLEKWARKNNYDISLVESYIDKENSHTDSDLWEDSVGIFRKNKSFDDTYVDIFCKSTNKQIYKWDSYFTKYHRYFSKYQNKFVRILEIGVDKGGSLQMWKNYFGENAKIVGIDINPESKQYEDTNITIEIGDQNDPIFMRSIVDKYKSFDVIIDDGSHVNSHQLFSFDFLFDYLNDGGIYLIEDIHTSYWEYFGGGYKNPNTMIEFSKNLIDDINGYIQSPQRITKYTNTISDIHFACGMVFIEKQQLKHTPHDILIQSGNIIDSQRHLPKKPVI